MKLSRVGIDLAKNVFQVHGVDRTDKPVWCRPSEPLKGAPTESGDFAIRHRRAYVI